MSTGVEVVGVDVLKYGAIGIGLVILTYTAGLLRQELTKPDPRPEARNLILLFMGFSLISFGLATYLELEKGRARLALSAKALASQLDSKRSLTVARIPNSALKRDLTVSDRQICLAIGEMYAELNMGPPPVCPPDPDIEAAPAATNSPSPPSNK